MGWQPKTKQKHRCPRCGELFYVLRPAGSGPLPASSLGLGTECPKCRKLRGSPLTRAGKNDRPPGQGR